MKDRTREDDVRLTGKNYFECVCNVYTLGPVAVNMCSFDIGGHYRIKEIGLPVIG